ncbi:MAG: MMPL family transporter [Planctomycetota bacterium]
MMPSAFRAARLSLNKKENDIKDWLPSDFVETSELEWFSDHFVGESFVIATWPGCNEDDQRLTLLESKLRHECASADPASDIDDPKLADDYRRAKQFGIDNGLLPAARSMDNWGGANEKWLQSSDEQWHYITPDGRLFRWEEKTNGLSLLSRSLRRGAGTYELKGTYITAFGDQEPSDIPNPFYNDPSLICAPIFQSVETGVTLASKLAEEGGPLWPVDLTDQSRRAVVAKRRATERLTGSLFAPAVPPEFAWTTSAFLAAVPADRRDAIPDDFESLVNESLDKYADDHLDGDRDALAVAPSDLQTEAWYAVFDSVGIEPPPRQTCLLITLTDIAKDHLDQALGRGIMGGPQGRLLQLANDSGVQPAAPPSMAPPPFDRPEIESIAGAPPLRLGGPPVDNVAIDEEGTVTLVRLVGYSIVVGFVLSYFCFGSLKVAMMVFVVGGSSAMLSMACVSWTNGSVDAVLMSMPSLVYVLGLSGAIHVVNYYRDEVRQSGRSGAAGRALKHALFPCSLAALTTAIGLGSLVTSNLTPINNFGFYSAIGVIATLAILFSYLPAALQTFVTDSKRVKEQEDQEPPAESWLSNAWASAGRVIARRHALVTVTCLLVLTGVGLGLRKIETSVQLLKLFDSEARIIRDYAWLEKNFGKLVPMELVLRVPSGVQEGQADSENGVAEAARLSFLERVEAVSRINYVVQETLGEPGLNVVGKATSADTFLPALPGWSNGYSVIRSHYEKQLTDGRDELLANDYLKLEESGPYAGSELWRISLRVDALSDVDYGAFIGTLRTAVEPVLRAYDTRDAVIRELVADGESLKAKKPRVLVVGAGRPGGLGETTLMETRDNEATPDESLIRRDAIYFSTLDELLRTEAIPKPIWIDPNAEDNKVDADRLIKVASAVDAVIWVGDQPADSGLIEASKAFVDGRQIFDQTIEHTLAEQRYPDAVGAKTLQVVYTGAIPVVYKAQRTLLTSLAQSIGMAFVLIAIVMVVLLNPATNPLRMLGPKNFGSGFLAGMVAMIPNVFPVLLVFGAMGHLGSLVDIGTMMTASVAMGVAVDDTIHFLSWFRSYLDRGFDRLKAVEMTYRRVGPAMTQTTIVGGIGLFVFALSTFTPTQRFGSLMLILLSAALVGDLVLLPALLAGPLGRFFRPREGSIAQRGSYRDELAIVEPEASEVGKDGIDTEGLPHLKLHAPKQRTDRSHRLGG